MAPGGRNKTHLAMLLVVFGLIAASCGDIERRELRITPTSTAEIGVRVVADNCPGPSNLALSIRDEVIWEVEAIPLPETVADETDSTIDSPADPNLSRVALREFIVGQTPQGWETLAPLEGPLSSGIRYTLRTLPDGQSIDFSTADLQAGLLFDGIGNRQFNNDLIDAECSEPADLGLFVSNVAVLAALWVTAAALVLVALIALLFVITRRFGRIRSIQQRNS